LSPISASIAFVGRVDAPVVLRNRIPGWRYNYMVPSTRPTKAACSRRGRQEFQLGHLETDTYDAVMTSERCSSLEDTLLESNPMLQRLPVLALLRADPVFHKATLGTLWPQGFQRFLQKTMGASAHHTMLEDDSVARRILLGWCSRAVETARSSASCTIKTSQNRSSADWCERPDLPSPRARARSCWYASRNYPSARFREDPSHDDNHLERSEGRVRARGAIDISRMAMLFGSIGLVKSIARCFGSLRPPTRSS